MSKRLCLIACCLIVAACGARRAALVPEVSADLSLIGLENLSLSAQPAHFFRRGPSLGVLQPDGRYFLVQPEPLRLLAAGALPSPLLRTDGLAADLALLRDTAAGKAVLFDLFAGRPLAEWPLAGPDALLALDRRFRFLRQGEELILVANDSGRTLLRLPAGKYPDPSLHLGAGAVHGSGGRSLFVFRPGGAAPAGEFLLPVAAASGGLLLSGRFYYGSGDRELICFSLSGRRTLWRRRLPDGAVGAPFAWQGRIAVLCRGDALLFFNRRGSLEWWAALPSYVRSGPAWMKTHLAFLLADDRIAFVDLGRRRISCHDLGARPAAGLFAAGGFLFLTSSAPAGESRKVLRFGNRFGIDIGQEPESAVVGRSLVFTITPRNVVRPQMTATIRDASGRELLKADLASHPQASLAWIADRGGLYSLQVRAKAENGEFESTREFRVLDWKEWLSRLVSSGLRGL